MTTVLQQTVPIVILGTDALLAAHPATPVQLAHALLSAGYASVIPGSWGDELVATAVVRKLQDVGAGPLIQCSCPIVAHRLLNVSGDLRPVLLPLVTPPVAAARYVRTLMRPTNARVTYVGNCPGAIDDSIDIRMSPESLLAMLAERRIVVEDQPHVFESIIPPDRRRFRSQPGGLPSSEALWSDGGARTLVEVLGDDIPTEIAQSLLSGKNVLIDASLRLGCVCAGANAGIDLEESRKRVAVLEPPRANHPVIDAGVPLHLDLAIPAVPRTPVDVTAVADFVAPPSARDLVPSRGEIEETAVTPVATPAPARATSSDVRTSRPMATLGPRPVVSVLPTARGAEGNPLPRAYVARRRSTPRGVSIVPPLPVNPVTPRAVSPAPEEARDGHFGRNFSAEGSTSFSTPKGASPAQPSVGAQMAQPSVVTATAHDAVAEEARPLPSPRPRVDSGRGPATIQAPASVYSRRTGILIAVVVLVISLGIGVAIGRRLVSSTPIAAALVP